MLTFRVERGGAGLVHLTCDEMRGLLVSGESVNEVMTAAPAVIDAIHAERRAFAGEHRPER